MAHKAMYVDRLEVIEGQVYRVVNAVYKNMSLDVYKVNLHNYKCYMRDNLVLASIGGWLVNYPNEKVRHRYSYGTYIQELCEWQECTRIEGLEYGKWLTEADKQILLIHFPQHKYLINKLPMGITALHELPQIFQTYEEHPQSETLFQLGFFKIAENKNLYKMKRDKLKQIIRWINLYGKDVEYKKILTLKAIQYCIKYNIPLADYEAWKGNYAYSKLTYEEYLYCKKKNINYFYYNDILQMAKSLGHNIEDAYWKYPNDPVEMHNRLMEQRKIAQKQKEQLKISYLEKISHKNLKNEVDLGNGYTLFIPSTYEQVEAAATTLKQCLLSCDYISKVAKGTSILVMIWHDGKPSSTAEIDYNKRILQFYGDESDRNNCKPSDIEQQYLNQWLETFKPKKLETYLPSTI